MIRRALISVYDKQGLEPFARGLVIGEVMRSKVTSDDLEVVDELRVLGIAVVRERRGRSPP